MFYCVNALEIITIISRVLVAGGGLIVLCGAVCKRLQKRRPKDQGFGKKYNVNMLYKKYRCVPKIASPEARKKNKKLL